MTVYAQTSKSTARIDYREVMEIFEACQAEDNGQDGAYVFIRGLTYNLVRFDLSLVNNYQPKIDRWLEFIDRGFFEPGGRTFHEAGTETNEAIWTSNPERLDQFLILLQATGKIECLDPPEIWILGFPRYRVKRTGS